MRLLIWGDQRSGILLTFSDIRIISCASLNEYTNSYWRGNQRRDALVIYIVKYLGFDSERGNVRHTLLRPCLFDKNHS